MEKGAKSTHLDPELSRRLHRALTCGKEELFEAILDSSPEVLRAALRNPALDGNHLLALLGRRDLTEELLKTVAGLDTVAGNHNLTVALVQNPGTPAGVALSLLPRLYLFELVTLSELPGTTPDQRLAAERAIIQRLPTTPLGNRITLARRASAAVLDALMKEGDVRVVEPCLANPRLKEASVFQLVSSSRSSSEAIAAVARHQRWANRPNLKGAMLKNPRTPTPLFVTLLAGAPAMELRNLAASGRLGQERKRLIGEELRRRGF
ncbi:hypothetical protein KI811_08995 [Geobacter hydrogenophilus]|uniref:Uncharacterized protein n=1 Tax=Geobacter hydrogenophilus TaxID=40983 RepID=A0A9W6G0D1_9BACT|nr:hypothetical protein [Geobacter hydrogenophilus]MBT0893947.1 hypothetical protein [Geobacter hydrogenophilus]GLI38107.1 hypothetical protein GHYDROH2_16080 [Geobacter hydrogenophilus]